MNEILQSNIDVNSRTVLLSIFNREQWEWTVKELITKLTAAARLIRAKKLKLKQEFQLNDWYKEIWNLAINDDKLTGAIKV